MLKELLRQHHIVIADSAAAWSDLVHKFKRSVVVKRDGCNVVLHAVGSKLELSSSTPDGQLTWTCDCNSNGIVKCKVDVRGGGTELPDVVFLLGAADVKSAESRVLDRFVDACKRVRYGHVTASEIVPVTITIVAEGSRKKIALNVNPLQMQKLVRGIRKLARAEDQGQS